MTTFALVLMLLVLSAESLSAQASFFAGKTIRIVVGLPAGDAYDIYARTLATYMGKHIPGNPTLMVQNMPGASSMITANYVYNVAKPDGLTFGSILPSSAAKRCAADLPSRRFSPASHFTAGASAALSVCWFRPARNGMRA
jgi:tripartite-type tricarboxylate transporter receptor subunit TctC